MFRGIWAHLGQGHYVQLVSVHGRVAVYHGQRAGREDDWGLVSHLHVCSHRLRTFRDQHVPLASRHPFRCAVLGAGRLWDVWVAGEPKRREPVWPKRCSSDAFCV